MDVLVFFIAAAIVLTGAMGVVMARNPVHAALMLVMTLFGIAVLFVLQEAHFLAAVQVVVYAGAIVVLFLFVIMLLGVDVAEDVTVEPLVGQRTAALVISMGTLGLLSALVIRAAQLSLGMPSGTQPLDGEGGNLVQLARVLFTDYLFAFEATSVLLVIAVVGAVVLSNRTSSGASQ
ncbi:MAG: NADH-quinone oxidoreductase subunit J [Acidimicrobiales bacterium]